MSLHPYNTFNLKLILLRISKQLSLVQEYKLRIVSKFSFKAAIIITVFYEHFITDTKLSPDKQKISLYIDNQVRRH